jgi:hypothetical protein
MIASWVARPFVSQSEVLAGVGLLQLIPNRTCLLGDLLGHFNVLLDGKR